MTGLARSGPVITRIRIPSLSAEIFFLLDKVFKMSDVTYFKGTGENLIHHMDWTPAVDTVPGTVVVIGDTPCVSKTMGPTGVSAPANVLTSIRVRGGVYSGIGAGVITGRKRIYWDNTAKKFTLVAAGNKHFGYSSPDTNSADGDAIYVEHDPNGGPSSQGATATVAATGSVQGDAAALSPGFNLVTGADATVGVRLPAGVDGMEVTVKNRDSDNAILKVYPATGGAINAIAANGAISMAAKTSATFRYLASTGFWYTTPLVPS